MLVESLARKPQVPGLKPHVGGRIEHPASGGWVVIFVYLCDLWAILGRADGARDLRLGGRVEIRNPKFKFFGRGARVECRGFGAG